MQVIVHSISNSLGRWQLSLNPSFLCVLALSSVIGCPIDSYFPISDDLVPRDDSKHTVEGTSNRVNFQEILKYGSRCAQWRS